MKNETLLGLWIVRITDTPPAANTLLARVQDELYILAFSSAGRAGACMQAFGTQGTPFYICTANIDTVLRGARDEGARGYIVDYDAVRASFTAAHPLPSGVPPIETREAREMR